MAGPPHQAKGFQSEESPVKMKMYRRSRWETSNLGCMGKRCSLCLLEDEDEDHLFVRCPVAAKTWNAISTWWNLDVSTLPSIKTRVIFFSAAHGSVGPTHSPSHKFTCSSPLNSPIALRRRSAASPAYLFINVVVSDLCSNFIRISSVHISP
ncbi:hypothetical protein L1987_55532 [Smallanthus sonchifolius]|uniref:Uncharacterized protein n=1 Tax=Smallanthus sonchifolius TaxID=185202 RepID=A0ACB9EBA0_9ASTR|nr:hypothetical protein L1987_55532 [Smallanthus sonchifolius]